MLELTVEDVHAFVKAINIGRKAIGEDSITTIQFDEATSNNHRNCLSARHLFVRGPHDQVFSTEALTKNAPILRDTFHTNGYDRSLEIPEEILKVTAVFDKGSENRKLLSELRALFVEAGYVAPS